MDKKKWLFFQKQGNVCDPELLNGTVCIVESKIQAMRSKELSVELCDRIVSMHRSGERYQNMSAALKLSRTQWPPFFLNGRSSSEQSGEKSLPWSGR